MQVWFFGAACLVNVIALAVHVSAGGRQFVRPLLASDLDPEIKWMAYFKWHVATVSVAAAAILFLIAAAGHAGYGIFAVGFAASIAVLALGVAVKSRLGVMRFPIILLNSVVVALGVAGLITG